MNTFYVICFILYIIGFVAAGVYETIRLVFDGNFYKFNTGLFRIVFWPLVVPFVIKEIIKARRDKSKINRVKDVL